MTKQEKNLLMHMVALRHLVCINADPDRSKLIECLGSGGTLPEHYEGIRAWILRGYKKDDPDEAVQFLYRIPEDHFDAYIYEWATVGCMKNPETGKFYDCALYRVEGYEIGFEDAWVDAFESYTINAGDDDD
jgi:hypothetical protein